MNERGLFSAIGICLLLVSAIFIKGIQEFEANYSRGVATYQAEHILQNLAEKNLVEYYHNLPAEFDGIQKFSKTLGTYGKLQNVKIVVWAQRQDTISEIKPGKGTVLSSVASCDSLFITGQIYRHVLAYILDGDATVYFVNQLPEEN